MAREASDRLHVGGRPHDDARVELRSRVASVAVRADELQAVCANCEGRHLRVGCNLVHALARPAVDVVETNVRIAQPAAADQEARAAARHTIDTRRPCRRVPCQRFYGGAMAQNELRAVRSTSIPNDGLVVVGAGSDPLSVWIPAQAANRLLFVSTKRNHSRGRGLMGHADIVEQDAAIAIARHNEPIVSGQRCDPAALLAQRVHLSLPFHIKDANLQHGGGLGSGHRQKQRYRTVASASSTALRVPTHNWSPSGKKHSEVTRSSNARSALCGSDRLDGFFHILHVCGSPANRISGNWRVMHKPTGGYDILRRPVNQVEVVVVVEIRSAKHSEIIVISRASGVLPLRVRVASVVGAKALFELQRLALAGLGSRLRFWFELT